MHPRAEKRNHLERGEELWICPCSLISCRRPRADPRPRPPLHPDLPQQPRRRQGVPGITPARTRTRGTGTHRFSLADRRSGRMPDTDQEARYRIRAGAAGLPRRLTDPRLAGHRPEGARTPPLMQPGHRSPAQPPGRGRRTETPVRWRRDAAALHGDSKPTVPQTAPIPS